MFARNLIRTGAAAVLLSTLAWGQPTLTTISDTLFKADGTRFNGLAQFTWLSYNAADGSNIAQQSTTVRIIDGNLLIKLAPTTTAAPLAEYSVLYNSDGKIQFSETWNVPPSTTPLRVRDVRTTAPLFPTNTGRSGGAGGVTQILESDVTGLIADLTARPVEGPGYIGGRAAVINASGQIEAAVGTTNNCLHVDGTSAACPGTINFVDAETPGGVVDGSNTSFTLANAPTPAASLHLFRNGMLQKATFDYTLSGSAVTFLAGAVPLPSDTLIADYRH